MCKAPEAAGFAEELFAVEGCSICDLRLRIFAGAGDSRQKQSRGKGGEVSTQPCSKIWSTISMGVAAGVACCYAFPRCRAMTANASPSSFSSFPTGAHMKLSINYKHVESHKPIEVEVERHAAKLRKLLQSYSPDLVQLHGAFSKTPRTDENSCSLNLSLPTGTLHAT